MRCKKQKGVSKVGQYYDEIAREYDQEYSESPYWRLYEAITWENMRRYLPKHKEALILDAGGGTGRWSIPIAKLGYRLVLTDISKNMLKVTEKKIKAESLENKIELRKMDIVDMSDFNNDYFDMVMAEGDPLSYCENPDKAVKEMARVAKKGAPVLASVDNRFAKAWWSLKEGNVDEAKHIIETGEIPPTRAKFPIHAFTPKELKELYEKHSLKVDRIIGKPILCQCIPREERDSLLSDEKAFSEILKLEIKFCDNENLVGLGGHIEIVGFKNGKLRI